jgi:hypothetical protein
MNEADGQLHTLSVLEQLREASKCLWGASSEAYFRVDELLRELANSNSHDIAISPFGSKCGTSRISAPFDAAWVTSG